MVTHNNWDTHTNNFHILKNTLLPQLDAGIGTLLRDLSDRGLLETTMVVVMGEFGARRGSTVPPAAITGDRPTRFCWPAAASAAAASSARRTSTASGRSATRTVPKISPRRFITASASIRMTSSTRPKGARSKIVNNGRVISELV